MTETRTFTALADLREHFAPQPVPAFLQVEMRVRGRVVLHEGTDGAGLEARRAAFVRGFAIERGWDPNRLTGHELAQITADEGYPQ